MSDSEETFTITIPFQPSGKWMEEILNLPSLPSVDCMANRAVAWVETRFADQPPRARHALQMIIVGAIWAGKADA